MTGAKRNNTIPSGAEEGNSLPPMVFINLTIKKCVTYTANVFFCQTYVFNFPACDKMSHKVNEKAREYSNTVNADSDFLYNM